MELKPSFDNRIRFNWGFHDGRAHAATLCYKRVYTNAFGVKMQKHFDKVYAAGWFAGMASEPTNCSDSAWAASGLKPGLTLSPKNAVLDYA